MQAQLRRLGVQADLRRQDSLVLLDVLCAHAKYVQLVQQYAQAAKLPVHSSFAHAAMQYTDTDADTYTGADLDALKVLVRKAQRSALARVQADLQQHKDSARVLADSTVQARLLDALQVICTHTGLRVLRTQVQHNSSTCADLQVQLAAPTHTGAVQQFTLTYLHTRTAFSKARSVCVGSATHLDLCNAYTALLKDAGMQ
jgi:hypothetical protein